MRGWVSAPQQAAVEAGVAVLRRGGNAFDAAIATAFVQGVVDFMMGGPGGLGTMTLYDAAREEYRVVDFYERAPGKATADMFEPMDSSTQGYYGFYAVKDHANVMGYRAVCVPGTVRGLHLVSQRYGSRPWAELLQPAIDLATDGFQIRAEQANGWARASQEWQLSPLTKITATAESKRLYTKGGEPFNPGDSIVLTDYGNTLRRIAQQGPDALYTGQAAELIERDFSANGGLITADDLANYRPREGEPLRGTYRGYDIISNPPPGSGLAVIGLLNVLEGYDIGSMEPGGKQYLSTLAAAMSRVLKDRSQHLADPYFVDVPVAKLVSKEHAEQLRAELASTPERGPIAAEHRDTTHLSIVDSRGNAVSLTHTLGDVSGVVTPGLGFIWNNGMHRFNPYPGHANSIEPGKSRASGLCPTIVAKNGKPVLVIGSPGGLGMISGTVQTIVNLIDFNMGIVEAIVAPRIHAEGGLIQAEGRIPSWTFDALRGLGWEVRRSSAAYDRFAGTMHGIEINADGSTKGGADPRRGGAALSDAS